MSSASSMCQTYPVYTSDAPEDVSTALHGSGEGSLCTQGHASCGTPLYRCDLGHTATRSCSRHSKIRTVRIRHRTALSRPVGATRVTFVLNRECTMIARSGVRISQKNYLRCSSRIGGVVGTAWAGLCNFMLWG